MRTHAVGIGAIEQSRVGSDAETTADRLFDSFCRDLVSTLAADGEVVVLALSIDVHRKREVLAGLEQIQLFFEQQRVRTQIDILLARD